jgi:hypothetical protein
MLTAVLAFVIVAPQKPRAGQQGRRSTAALMQVTRSAVLMESLQRAQKRFVRAS